MRKEVDFNNPHMARTLTKGIEEANQKSCKANNLEALKLVGEFLLFLIQQSLAKPLAKPFRYISRLRF